jgi:threonine dehydrogenase-like Zn-dependent dehydrogenase
MTVAAFLEGPRLLAVHPHQLPDASADEVRIRVQTCAICATDLRAWARGSLLDHAGVTGHEIAGVVAAAGAEVERLAPGDRVTVEPNLAVCCGDCARCREGLTFFCERRRDLPAWGFAEEILVPAQAAIAIPHGMPTELAALTEPMACAVHALRRSWTGSSRGGRIDGVDVGIVGAGPIGLMALAAARRLGAGRVSVAARHPHQRQAARALGGEPIGEDPAELREAAPRLVIIAADAGPRVLAEALATVGGAGEVIVLGLLDEPQQIDARRAVLRGSRVTFSISHGGWGADLDFLAALEVLGSDFRAFTRLLSHRFELAEIARAFDLAADRSIPSFRVVVGPPAP